MPIAPVKNVASRRSRRQRDVDVAAVAFDTELGWMALAYEGETLLGVVFGHSAERQARERVQRYVQSQHGPSVVLDNLHMDQLPERIVDVVEKLRAYAAGEDVDFGDVRIDERHLTDFGRKIVKACRCISRGRTRTYGELAEACGSPGAARAVGQVMARNCYPLIVPCHRVLAAGGLIGGFSAPQGLSMKRRLLALERANT